MTYLDLDDPRSALPLAERALRMDATLLGPNHPATGIRLSNLASTLQALGDDERALPLLRDALRIAESIHGPNHPTTGTRLSNLAVVMQHCGDVNGALPLARRAVDIQLNAFGPGHSRTQTAEHNLGMILKEIAASKGRPDRNERAKSPSKGAKRRANRRRSFSEEAPQVGQSAWSWALEDATQQGFGWCWTAARSDAPLRRQSAYFPCLGRRFLLRRDEDDDTPMWSGDPMRG